MAIQLGPGRAPPQPRPEIIPPGQGALASFRKMTPARYTAQAMRRLALLTIWGALGLMVTPALAEMYRWTDDQGSVHYTQGPDSVPDRFRSKAQMMAFPERPAAPVASSLP